MIVFFAVVTFAIVRALVAGYGGTWFLPALAMEALDAAWPLLAVAGAAALLGRLLPQKLASIDALETVGLAGILMARFGTGWVEVHTALSETLRLSSEPNLALAATGIVAGALIAAFAAWAGQPVARCALVALAGWLILGPEIYERYDDVESARRLTAAAYLAAAAFVCGALGAFVATRSPRAARAFDSVVMSSAVAALIAAAVGPSQAPGGPSILLVGIDTFRADALDATTASGAPLMPRLVEIARSGVRFTQAVAPSPWTLPSFISLLSGMNPHRHKSGRLQGTLPSRGEAIASWSGPALRAAGYQAAAFVNNPWLRPYYGFGRGYLRFRRYRGDAADGVAIATAWIATHRHRPFFAFLHLMDPHWPYEAPAGFGEPRRVCHECDDLPTLLYQPASEEVRAEVRRRYHAELAYTDANVGKLWDELRASGVLDDTWLIVTSDHGEEFWEHQGFLHGHSLYDELLRVPLIVVPPLGDQEPKRGAVAPQQVRLEDVAATIQDLAGLRPPGAIDGTSLRGIVAGQSGSPAADAPRPVVAGYMQVSQEMGWAVRANGMKLIAGWKALPLLFDLVRDPGETQAITFEKPDAADALSRVPAALGLDVKSWPWDTTTTPDIADPDVVRELRALGYLQ